MYVDCSGWRNYANGTKIFEFYFDKEGNLTQSKKSIGANYNGMDVFKVALKAISPSSLLNYGASSSKFTVSIIELTINGKVYKALASLGSKQMSDTGCNFKYSFEYYE